VRGFPREVFSFVIWLVALFVAWTFHKELASAFAHWITSTHLRLVADFLILVLMLLKKKGLLSGIASREGVFGTARGAILVAMAVYLGLLHALAGKRLVAAIAPYRSLPGPGRVDPGADPGAGDRPVEGSVARTEPDPVGLGDAAVRAMSDLSVVPR